MSLILVNLLLTPPLLHPLTPSFIKCLSPSVSHALSFHMCSPTPSDVSFYLGYEIIGFHIAFYVPFILVDSSATLSFPILQPTACLNSSTLLPFLLIFYYPSSHNASHLMAHFQSFLTSIYTPS